MTVTPIANASVAQRTWSVDELTFTEVIRQEYTNCVFSAGTVEGHAVDTLYLELERDGDKGIFLLLRPDEAAALAWCLSGVLWSDALRKDVQGGP
jgi:hypothetical protein